MRGGGRLLGTDNSGRELSPMSATIQLEHVHTAEPMDTCPSDIRNRGRCGRDFHAWKSFKGERHGI